MASTITTLCLTIAEKMMAMVTMNGRTVNAWEREVKQFSFA
jgi:hypothetical protein